jgi:hypothetical protein
MSVAIKYYTTQTMENCLLKGHSHEKVFEIISLYHRFGPN